MPIIQVYRAILRQAGYLPHPYLQTFVKARASDYFRRHRNGPQPLKYLARARADLRRLERINSGAQKPFMKLLREAYGRTGKLRHELLQPHLASSDPTLVPRPPVIPSKASSAPPSYPPTLVSLLTSQRSITTSKPLSAAELLTPRTLPLRAVDPSSEEARLLGPFSLRRLANAHWRQYNEQIRRVLPPLEVRLLREEKSLRDKDVHMPITGLEKYKPVKALVKLASAQTSPPLKRLLRDGKQAGTEHGDEVQMKGARAPTQVGKSDLVLGKVEGRSRRWVRRRYRELLAEVPSLTEEEAYPAILGGLSISTPKFKVALVSPELALAHDVPRQLRTISPEEKEWIDRAERERWSTVSWLCPAPLTEDVRKARSRSTETFEAC